jgi:hypothetical protein
MNDPYNINVYKPFGPLILESKCPDNIINGLNQYIDEMGDDEKVNCSSKYTKDETFPNLLDRGFEVVYITPKTSFEVGLSYYILQIATIYSKYIGRYDSEVILPNSSFSDKFVDIWINRYFESDYTPPHSHRGDLSGIIMLDLQDDFEEKGSLEFVWDNEHYKPKEEIGKTFLFPSDLMHWVSRQKGKKERRTLSFNLYLKS